MFGESDSESPRAPSPWEALSQHNAIPKLAPEVEEGNVEYKLQLLSPTPARFDRLVTQLKWRLLEGGGQAYYEIGVADSGMLIGLPRQHLEESLDTLTLMAGEIGATVIVVREVEVPPELWSFAESQHAIWDGQKTVRRKDLLRMARRDESPSHTASSAEVETDLLTTDTEETSSYPATPISPNVLSDPTKLSLSPHLSPFDPALPILTVDMAEDVAHYADNEASDDDVTDDLVPNLMVRLKISSVYKPRPMKKRPTHTDHTEKGRKNGYPPSGTTRHPGDSNIQDSNETRSQPLGIKPQRRKDKRDKSRDWKSRVLPHKSPIQYTTGLPTNSIDHDHHDVPSSTEDPPDTSISQSQLTVVDSGSQSSPGLTAHPQSQLAVIDSQISDWTATTTVQSKEPRLIVEALVVWKLSLEEAFLDFEGFSLQ